MSCPCRTVIFEVDDGVLLFFVGSSILSFCDVQRGRNLFTMG